MPATKRPIQTRFRCAYTLRLKLAANINSLTHYAKGTRSPARKSEDLRPAPTACRHSVSGSLSPRSSRCFSPFPHGTRALSVAEEYLGLEGGPPIFRQDFSCPALLKDQSSSYPYGALTRYGPIFQYGSGRQSSDHWPGPRSLATTNGVSVDVLSSGYLDVSVPRVRLLTLWIQVRILLAEWVSPFGDLGIKGCSHLPQAFRSVPRPSSPLSAKASTKCPSFTRHAPDKKAPRQPGSSAATQSPTCVRNV